MQINYLQRLTRKLRLGFHPRTVIDAGVATQTPELYEEFRGASILLIEPLAEFEPFLSQICSAYRAQYVLAAAVLNVLADKVSSSLRPRARPLPPVSRLRHSRAAQISQL